ncbi:MAG: recombinase family protein [Anaerolineae bacterium]|jgi:site-specific DNA recombinase|nr:recombinase family protein [Anaerolineae bacterium]MBT7191741.1 recombinase family protein [Anaerolineae bacterium]MBT7324544.1 recombinase family protein [Anaerolineae bacterium]
MKKRAVLYARVSGDDRSKDGRNLAGQIEMCREYAISKGWDVVAEFSEDDRGASGASFELPELDRARDMAQAGEYDYFVVREIDRLSRKLAKQLIVEEQLKRADVEVVYVLEEYADSPEGRLNKHIRATIAEYEREKIAERMVRGRRQVVKNGKIMLHGNKPPFGYRLSEDKTTLVIHEEEAAIVRMIYNLYVEGDENGVKLATRAIADRLTEMKVPTWADLRGYSYKKRGHGEWSWRHVIEILRRETYVGRWHYGKRNAGANKYNPREYWLTFEVPVIIPEELWERAQTQRKANTTRPKRNVRHEYLLRRRGKCGHCGSAMNCIARKSGKKIYLYYICNGHMGGVVNVSCDLPGYRADHVDALVWEWIKSLLTQSDVLEQGLAAYHESKEQYAAPLRDRLLVMDDLMGDSRSQLDRLLDLYLSGNIPKEFLLDKKDSLEKTLASLGEERRNLRTQISAQAGSEADLSKLRVFAEEISAKLEGGDDSFERRRGIVELLDVRATMIVEDGQKYVDVSCFLASEKLSFETGTNRNGG